MTTPGVPSTGVIVSIGISALTTGYASAMITFDCDVAVDKRKDEPTFAGFIPDDNSLRGRCFTLMTLMSALHNLSRSVGCALLAASGGATMVLQVFGGEMLLYLAWKVTRGDIMYWIPIYGTPGVIQSFLNRFLTKIIVDFCGCLQLRHPCDYGGFEFSLSMLWAQAMPFVALMLYRRNGVDDTENGVEQEESTITIILSCSFGLWLLTNVVFFCTIDLAYLHTFWDIKTGPQFICDLFRDASHEEGKFIVFHKRISYTNPIHDEVKTWVAANIDRWREENPEWFDVRLIPDEFLPACVLLAEGGASRRKSSSVSLRELVGEGYTK